jgi:hypothetical protein
MILFHGTSASNLSSMLSYGVQAESYWGTLEQARSFSDSFDDGVILQADIDDSELNASLLMAESLYEAGELDELPDVDDVDYSLENLGGCVCLITVYNFSVVVQD